MALTKIDCSFYRGAGVSSDTSGFIALNPASRPGNLVIAFAAAVQESVSSQVACKLSLEHFVDGVLGFYEKRGARAGENPEVSLEVLEEAFKKANTSVYEFGHKLAAGGRMASSLVGLVVEQNMIAAGRVGDGSVLLYRNGQIFPFFDEKRGVATLHYVGAQSLVNVELASVPIQPNDIVLGLAQPVSLETEGILGEILDEVDWTVNNPCAHLCRDLFVEPQALSFSFLARIGPDAIYLSEVLSRAA